MRTVVNLTVGEFKNAPFVTRAGFCSILGISKMTLRNWEKEAKIPSPNVYIDRNVDEDKQEIRGDVAVYSLELAESVAKIFYSRNIVPVKIKKSDVDLIVEIQKLFQKESDKIR